jgi:hypothetical protein
LAAGAFSIERLEGSQFGRNRTFAVSVNEAVAVEKFDRENLGPLPVTTDDGVITQFGSRGKTEALVPMIATERLRIAKDCGLTAKDFFVPSRDPGK